MGYIGEVVRVMKGDTRSLDYGSFKLHRPLGCGFRILGFRLGSVWELERSSRGSIGRVEFPLNPQP